MNKKLKVLKTLIKVVAAIVAYTFILILILCEIMVTYGITPEYILDLMNTGTFAKVIGLILLVGLAIIGIPGKKRNMGF